MRTGTKLLALLLTLSMALSLTVTAAAAEEDGVTILYTNDVHTYIDQDLTYATVAAYKESLEDVLLVDAGDHIQGTAYGGMDQGATIIELMNAAGYDLATLGNHEFDYDMEGCIAAMEAADFPHCGGAAQKERSDEQFSKQYAVCRNKFIYAVLKGQDPSIKRYRHALAAPEKKQICQEADAALQAAYDQLPPEDKKHPFTAQSETARDYRLTARKLLDQKYMALANLCQE